MCVALYTGVLVVVGGGGKRVMLADDMGFFGRLACRWGAVGWVVLGRPLGSARFLT